MLTSDASKRPSLEDFVKNQWIESEMATSVDKMLIVLEMDRNASNTNAAEAARSESAYETWC
eukprot:922783-Prorocentrum_minimum.AAC.1